VAVAPTSRVHNFGDPLAAMNKIVVKGAREHNLKNVDVEIPRDKLGGDHRAVPARASPLWPLTPSTPKANAVTSSRCRLTPPVSRTVGKPDVDSIDGLSPAIAIGQRSASRNPRSSVGTITEIYDYLRLLWARVGEVYCWQCGQRIAAQTIPQMVDQVLAPARGARFSVLAPVVRDKKGDFRDELNRLRQDGYVRAKHRWRTVRPSRSRPKLDKTKKHSNRCLCRPAGEKARGRTAPWPNQWNWRPNCRAGWSRSRPWKATICFFPNNSPAPSVASVFPK